MSSESDKLAEAAGLLRAARRIVVFTGAGISAESGIATFRDDDGFWQRFPPDEFARWDGILAAFRRKPQRLAEFAAAVFGPIAVAEPNAGHHACVALQRHADVTIVTQNIDDLHGQAGSNMVWEIHGSLYDVATRAGHVLRRLDKQTMQRMATRLQAATTSRFPRTRLIAALRPVLGVGLRGVRRPGVVLFGASMAEPAWSKTLAAVRTCDCLLMVGTSGVVYPAATLPDEARQGGASIIAVDPESGDADFHLTGTAATVLPRLVAQVLNE